MKWTKARNMTARGKAARTSKPRGKQSNRRKRNEELNIRPASFVTIETQIHPPWKNRSAFPLL
jgi:hypothetical protein